tara:strand:+ start:335 stop:682 length:348 start_codon:yes stop_codon:yes gene_type:complete
MKWIGQHIVDLIARFRNNVYLEKVDTSLSTTVLVIDPDGKVGINAVGRALGDKNFVYDQGVASSKWIIAHNLGKFPSVSVVDSAKTKVVGEVTYTDTNNLIIEFQAGFSGKAYLN